MSKNLIPNYEWWTEEREWGAWHKPNSSTLQKRSCFNVTYESNEIGARDKSFILNSDNDIVLIGDSFAEGYGVNYNDTSQKHLEDLTKLNILNFGVSHNFGPVQYSIIYNKLAKKFKHNKILIYFLPDNDFGENDFNNWRGSKRYRPYYKKINENFYETFIPSNSIKNYTSATKKIKKKFKDYFWTSGLFINIYYQYKLHRSKKKNLKNNFSGYYDAPLSQQKAAIYFINEIVDKSIYVDFSDLSIFIDKHNYKVQNKDIYEISTDAGDIGRLLDGYQNWDDFMLSFRHKLHRSPDIYQVAINGFLTMEKEDIGAFCSNLMRLENQKERIIVSAGGVDYSVDKFCPHLGSDLSQGWIEDDRYLVCAKHRWMFDLEDGGQAIDADATINAVDLDGDGS